MKKLLITLLFMCNLNAMIKPYQSPLSWQHMSPSTQNIFLGGCAIGAAVLTAFLFHKSVGYADAAQKHKQKAVYLGNKKGGYDYEQFMVDNHLNCKNIYPQQLFLKNIQRASGKPLFLMPEDKHYYDDMVREYKKARLFELKEGLTFGASLPLGLITVLSAGSLYCNLRSNQP